MSGWRQARAIALLPGNVTVVVPALILVASSGPDVGWGLEGALAAIPIACGAALIATAFSLWLWTVLLFGRIGRGTLAAWDPTSRLVLDGPYRYVRNPMITAVATLLIGESILFGSLWILAWAAAFLAINFAYFIRFEEPGLEQRFGEQYAVYKQAVPRWIPRRGAWRPS